MSAAPDTTGIPGIGKTTLAEVLLADLVDRQGFTAYRIAHDLVELRPVKNPKSKQVFYFDDFLGKTALEKLQKNEDQRLVELMEEVAANPNWRFILTTSEYILNIAKRRYEAFAHPPIDLTLCVINLSDYTRPIRAQILYNHIYFSDLPKEYKGIAVFHRRTSRTVGLPLTAFAIAVASVTVRGWPAKFTSHLLPGTGTRTIFSSSGNLHQ